MCGLTRKQLEDLGFERVEVSAEESGSEPFTYYSLDIENIDFISTEVFECEDRDSFTVTLLESNIPLSYDVLKSLIEHLEKNI